MLPQVPLAQPVLAKPVHPLRVRRRPVIVARLKTCVVCSQAFLPRTPRVTRCPEHELHGRAHRSPTTQHQDAEYHRLRKEIVVPGATCFHCGAPATTLDHHPIPVAEHPNRGVPGKSVHEGNVVPCCGPCNFRKQHRSASTLG